MKKTSIKDLSGAKFNPVNMPAAIAYRGNLQARKTEKRNKTLLYVGLGLLIIAVLFVIYKSV